jgi:endoglycosylceramidase
VRILAVACAVLAVATAPAIAAHRPRQPLRFSPPALLPLHAEPDPERGGRIVDSRGREVLLRGVNVNSLVEYWQGTRFPTVFPLDARDPERMAGLGWNAVRLLLSWSRVEPSPGRYDQSYLDRAAATVQALKRAGIYSIVDLHQDAWGATLAARPDEVCAPPQRPAIGWDGAPGWATLDGGQPRCYYPAREFNPAVRQSWVSWLSDAAGPGGVGIQTRYVSMLRHVAQRFAREAGVAGFDLMNEPNTLPSDDQLLSQFYGRALRAVREGERAAGGFPHLVLFEPSGLWSSTGRGAPPDFPRDRDVVYSPHIYAGSITIGESRHPTRDDFQIARDEARQFGGAPILTGEWGADPDRARPAPAGDGYFVEHQRLQDEFRYSATMWGWFESCGDPHKAEDVRAGGVPEVWGMWEVDCRDNSLDGMRPHLVRALSRAYVRAAPGRLESISYDDRTGAFRATGVAPRGSAAELVVFYPKAKHGGIMRVAGRGLRGPVTMRAPSGGRLITYRARGGAWSVSITRR